MGSDEFRLPAWLAGYTRVRVRAAEGCQPGEQIGKIADIAERKKQNPVVRNAF